MHMCHFEPREELYAAEFRVIDILTDLITDNTGIEEFNIIQAKTAAGPAAVFV